MGASASFRPDETVSQSILEPKIILLYLYHRGLNCLTKHSHITTDYLISCEKLYTEFDVKDNKNDFCKYSDHSAIYIFTIITYRIHVL